jgi:hypothetical protein
MGDDESMRDPGHVIAQDSDHCGARDALARQIIAPE